MVLSVASLGCSEEETSVITRKALNHYRKTATLQMGRQVGGGEVTLAGTCLVQHSFALLIYVQYFGKYIIIMSYLCIDLAAPRLSSA